MYPAVRAYVKVFYEYYKAIARSKPNVAHWLDTYHSLVV
jgi:hypothetical protein